jgi:hypothetical protein
MKHKPTQKPADQEALELAHRLGASEVDSLVMRAEVRVTRGPTDEYESYLVLRSGDKTWPYIHIPETLPDDVLEAALAKLNA